MRKHLENGTTQAVCSRGFVSDVLGAAQFKFDSQAPSKSESGTPWALKLIERLASLDWAY